MASAEPREPLQAAPWMAAPPPDPPELSPGPGELAPPGPAAVRNHVDIPVRPGDDR